MCTSLGSSDSVAGHLVTFKFYKILLKFINKKNECFDKDYEHIFHSP